MIHEQHEELASLYALGALDAAEARAFEAEMHRHPELRELVRSLQRTAAALTRLAPAAAPPGEEFKTRLLGRLASSQSPAPGAAGLPGSMPGFAFRAASDAAGWKALPVPGAYIKALSANRQKGYAVLLGRLEGGVRYPAHFHHGAEDFCILTGDLHVGGVEMGPGDFHHADAGTEHGVNYSIGGCTLIAVIPLEHELAQFALAT
jgi:anti-sigma factor ChrR (cupin superfamily)